MRARTWRMGEDEDYVVINIDVLRATLRAVHARCADNVPRWIPRSLIFGPDERKIAARIGQLTAIKVFRWFAVKEHIPIAPTKKAATTAHGQKPTAN